MDKYEFKRVETLGDAVINLCVVEYVSTRFPSTTNQTLIAHLKSNSVLTIIAKKIGVTEHIHDPTKSKKSYKKVANAFEFKVGIMYSENGIYCVMRYMFKHFDWYMNNIKTFDNI